MTENYKTDLSHLDPDEIEVFYQRYLIEKAGMLVKDYNLKPSLANSLYTLLPSDKCQPCCEVCGAPELSAKKVSKKNFSSEPPEPRIANCQACGHEQYISDDLKTILSAVDRCNCDFCCGARDYAKMVAKQKQEDATKNQLEKDSARIVEAFSIEREYIPFSEAYSNYNLSDVAMLMALLFARWTNKDGDNDSNDYIAPVSSSPIPLYASDTVLQGHPISSCIRHSLISFDLSRAIHKNFIVKDGESIRYYPFDIPFQSNFISGDGETLSNKQVYEWLSRKFTDGYWYRDWNDQLLSVWIDLGVAECIEYAKYMADEYNFEFNCESKISETIRDLLHRYSVSECFYFIYVAYKNAAAFAQSGKSAGRRHAENTVPGKILSLANSGKSQKWDRLKALPRSAFSVMLFDVMLRSKNDAGFNLCPGEYYTALLSKVEVEWPELAAETISIDITGEAGVYDFFGCLPDVTFEDSKDSEHVQLANLIWIARVLGLKKAAEAVNEKLLSESESEQQD